MYVILIYDIKQIGQYAYVQRHVFQTCKCYLKHIQNSVFEGELSLVQITKLKKELQKYLRSDLDSCILFKSRNSRWLIKEFFTMQLDENEQFI